MLGSDLFLKLNMGYEVVGLDKEEIDIVSASECEEAIKEINRTSLSMPPLIPMLMGVNGKRRVLCRQC